MSGAAPIEAVYGLTADDDLASLVGDDAYLAVPDADGFRIADAWRLVRPIAEWRRADFYGAVATVTDEAGFRAYVEERAQHRREQCALARKRGPRDVETPWGGSQSSEIYAEGVVLHITAGHGSFKLDDARNAAMPAMLRIQNGWYEEDCEWAKVAFGFPDLFTAYERRIAERTLRDAFPDCWEAIHGRLLAPGESFRKDRCLFQEMHAGDWVVISAITSGARPGFTECIATLGGNRQASPQRRFLVPNDEYRAGPHGFVIDLARHKAWNGPTSFLAR